MHVQTNKIQLQNMGIPKYHTFEMTVGTENCLSHGMYYNTIEAAGYKQITYLLVKVWNETATEHTIV